jgi:hypothetical protein
VLNCRAVNVTDTAYYDNMTLRSVYVGNRSVGSGNHGICTLYSNGFVADANTISTASGIGICVGGAASTTQIPANGFAITGNNVRNSTLCNIQVDTTVVGALTSPVDTYGAVTGNNVVGAGQHGIYLHNAQYMTVTGNVSRANIGSGIALDSTYCAIDGNLTVGNNGDGISFYGTAAAYGHHSVGRNISRGNAGPGYTFSATGGQDSPVQLSGTGAPTIAAPVGSTYMRVDGGAATSFYVKESGGFTTSGWVAK